MTDSDGLTPPDSTSRKIPAAIWGLALLATLLHTWPYVVGYVTPPAGWEFTGNYSGSPDYAQYRVWMQQSQEEGPIVSDRFTAEPNHPHLPVVLYWTVGRLGRAFGVAPEFVFAALGIPVVFLLVLVFYEAVRRFLPPGRPRAWALGLMLFGGGLGAYLKDLRDLGYATGNGILRRLVIWPLSQYSVLEDIRGQYVVNSLYETHFAIIWLLATAAVLAFHSSVVRPSPWRVLKAALFFMLVTVIHLHEGITLGFITAFATIFIWAKGYPVRSALTSLVACGIATLAVLFGMAMIQRGSGIPMADWFAEPMLLSLVLLGYPLQAPLIGWGLHRYWQEADLSRAFLLGWIVGCLTLTFAAPFYPWPDRGTMTLPVAVAIVSAAIYFRDRSRVKPWHAVVALLLVGYTPIQVNTHMWERLKFTTTDPFRYLGPEHRAILKALGQAGPEELLLSSRWDVQWLAPAYRGRHYAGHFFLTVDYPRKDAEMQKFYQATTEEQTRFLLDNQITLLFVDAKNDPARYRAIPGLEPLVETSVGTLFRFTPGPVPAPAPAAP